MLEEGDILSLDCGAIIEIVGLRREDEEIEVHVIGCDTLASGVDADWLDLAWAKVRTAARRGWR